MGAKYRLVAGSSLGRLAALSDGVFAFAMTLLAVDLRVPEIAAVHSEGELARALGALVTSLIPWLMSFMTLGIFWVGQQTQLNFLDRSDRDLAWIHLGFLLAVTLTPFSTALLAHFITYKLALAVYWANIFLLGATLFASWRYARRAGLVQDDLPAGTSGAIEKRIVGAQLLYAFGAALCFVSTYLSIGFIVLLQLNYALAPRIRGLRRL